MVSKERIGDIFVRRGILCQASAEQIGRERLKSDTRYTSVAVRSGRISVTQALQCLGAQAPKPIIDLDKLGVSRAAIELIPFEIARQQLLFPFAVEEQKLLLAMADPHDRQIIEEIGFATGLTIEPHIAMHAQLGTRVIEAYCTHHNDVDKNLGPAQELKDPIKLFTLKKIAIHDVPS